MIGGFPSIINLKSFVIFWDLKYDNLLYRKGFSTVIGSKVVIISELQLGNVGFTKPTDN
jgi:hypothetical protein